MIRAAPILKRIKYSEWHLIQMIWRASIKADYCGESFDSLNCLLEEQKMIYELLISSNWFFKLRFSLLGLSSRFEL